MTAQKSGRHCGGRTERGWKPLAMDERGDDRMEKRAARRRGERNERERRKKGLEAPCNGRKGEIARKSARHCGGRDRKGGEM